MCSLSQLGNESHAESNRAGRRGPQSEWTFDQCGGPPRCADAGSALESSLPPSTRPSLASCAKSTPGNASAQRAVDHLDQPGPGHVQAPRASEHSLATLRGTLGRQLDEGRWSGVVTVTESELECVSPVRSRRSGFILLPRRPRRTRESSTGGAGQALMAGESPADAGSAPQSPVTGREESASGSRTGGRLASSRGYETHRSHFGADVSGISPAMTPDGPQSETCPRCGSSEVVLRFRQSIQTTPDGEPRWHGHCGACHITWVERPNGPPVVSPA
jgi:hypothetical protein